MAKRKAGRVPRSILVQPQYATQRGEGWSDFTNFVKKAARKTYKHALKPLGNHIKKLPAVTHDVLKIATPIVKIPFGFMGAEGKAAAQGFDIATDLSRRAAGRGRRQRGGGNFPYAT